MFSDVGNNGINVRYSTRISLNMMSMRRGAETKSGKGTPHQRRDKQGNLKKKENSLTAVFISGWNLPFLKDDNDIVSWMKREKNGDNKIKPRHNEERPEESFRHSFDRCQAVENEMEFERESLHERYRKHCQFGPMPTSKKENAGQRSLQENILQEPLPPRRIKYPRSCKSAELPATPKESTRTRMGPDMLLSANMTPVMSRSHSVIDDVQLKRYGLTLPPDEKTARLLELAEKFTSKLEKKTVARKPESEDLVDEGYDSKVSSNDADGLEDDGEESKVGQYDAASIYTNLESLMGIADTATINCELQEHSEEPNEFPEDGINPVSETEGDPSSSALAHRMRANQNTDSSKDAIAKLMYSRRGRNIYERTPSRRCKDNTFKYAGKEQSRLMETSLNNITPGYLNIHYFAQLAGLNKHLNISDVDDLDEATHPLLLHFTQLNNQQQQQQQQLKQQQQHQQPQQPHSDLGDRTLPMRTITIQDKTKHSRNGLDDSTFHNIGKENALPAADAGKESHFPRGNASPSAMNNERFVTDSQGIPLNDDGASYANKTLPNGSSRKVKSPRLCIQDLSSNVALLPNRLTVAQLTRDPISRGPSSQDECDQSDSKTSAGGDNHQLASPYTSTDTKTPQNISSVLLKYCQKEPNLSLLQFNDNCNASSVDTSRTSKSTDRHSERVPSTTFFPVGDLLPAVEKNLRRRKKKGQSKQQMMYRSQTLIETIPWKRYESEVGKPSQVPTMTSTPQGTSTALGMTVEDVMDRRSHHSLQTQKAYGPPGFRPHHALSPLQRAKEIVNRRLHGHVTQLPDGSETVRVTSPLYQTTRFDRINSASRKLGRMVNGTWKESNDLRSKSETTVMCRDRRHALADAHLRGH